MAPEKIIFFTKYTKKGPSSRYRIFQYSSFYKKEGFNIEILPLLDDNYIDNLYSSKPYSKFKILKCYFKRILQVIKLSSKNLIYVQYELLPYFPPVLEWYISKIKKAKYIVDYDDAMFHNYDMNSNWWVKMLFSRNIPKVIYHANVVITGSPYLTSFAQRFSKDVVEIPTSIDLQNYIIKDEKTERNNKFVIGWIGSKTTSNNIISILPSLVTLSKKVDFELRLIGFNKNLLQKLEGINFKNIPWSQENEVAEIRKFDVGIMPLTDNPFNRGKCGFKLIQYMACGLTTISTPLEANLKINQNKKNLHASSEFEWYQALFDVWNNIPMYRQQGIENRSIIEKNYSIQSNGRLYINIFKSLLNK